MKNSRTKRPLARGLETSGSKRPTYAELRRQLADSLNRVKAIDNEAVRLPQLLQDFKRCLSEALEQATSEILGLIAGSAINIQAVLNAIADSAPTSVRGPRRSHLSGEWRFCLTESRFADRFRSGRSLSVLAAGQ
jgi:hypothetical protein